MHYGDTVEESRQYLRLTLELIGKHGLPTDPLNYAVWYEYATGKNQDLIADIDALVEKNGVFSGAILQDLYNRHIIGKEKTTVTLIRKQLKKIFIESITAIQNTRREFSESENKLEQLHSRIPAALSDADMERLVRRIKDEINQLESSNSAFMAQLHQATQEIDELKLKLEKCRKEVLHDPMTRIANRRGFDEMMASAILNANSEDLPLCLIVADIDHFKRFNDTHGHLVGDKILRTVASTIKDSIKGRDLVARIGGEEFAILLPNTPAEGGAILAESIRQIFDKMDLKKKNSGEPISPLTVSFGVTDYKKGESSEAFFHRADQALYRSKAKGRNRVTRF